MRIFDTNVQLIKYKVLREVIRKALKGDLKHVYMDLVPLVSPGPKSEIRCCIYKERAILQERIKMVMGGNKENKNVVEVIDIACDECPTGGLYVTPACRGCMLHKCVEVCPRGAITIINKKAVIDKGKCIECGKCMKACPYGAIIPLYRPCVQSCKVKAISVDAEGKAKIDNDKCISCGACVYQCPFGAISDKSFVVDVVDILKKSENNTKYKVYAIVAPAIASQFKHFKIGQLYSAINKLGFYKTVEAAMGADITLYKELKELEEKEVMTTSCCPSFVSLIEKNYPELKDCISSTPSPMVETAMLLKREDPTAKVVFIGPCVSKKNEYTLEKTDGAVDCVISFEELQAFIDAKDIDVDSLEETILNDGSFYGRIFAKSGGIAYGVADIADKKGIRGINPIVMSGLDSCKLELAKLKAGRSLGTFFEGMACEGGCQNGPLNLTHNNKNAMYIDNYGKEATEKRIDKNVFNYLDSIGISPDAED